MNLQRFIVILTLVVIMGLVLAYQHARIIGAGYEMSRLSREREVLTERQRVAAAELVELKRAEAIAARAEKLGLELVPASETGRVMVSQNWEASPRY